MPAAERGSALGPQAAAISLCALPASLLAGWMWQAIGRAAPFYYGAVMVLAATLLLLRT